MKIRRKILHKIDIDIDINIILETNIAKINNILRGRNGDGK